MSKELEKRVVDVDGDEVAVYKINNPESLYSAVYQNKDTRTLDERFGLTGKPVGPDSETGRYLRLAVGGCSLGKTEVEYVLRAFVIIAMKNGHFLGFPEEELKQNIKKGKIKMFDEYDLDLALRYKDGMNDGATYLKRVNVEGTDVIFPANLQKQLI